MSETQYRAFAHVPLAMFRQMRLNDPIHFDSRMHGWSVFRYEDALFVLKAYSETWRERTRSQC